MKKWEMIFIGAAHNLEQFQLYNALKDSIFCPSPDISEEIQRDSIADFIMDEEQKYSNNKKEITL